MVRIKLLHLHCMLNEESDKDEVFVKFNGHRVWPEHGRYHVMNSNERIALNIVLEHDPSKDLHVELWDWDLLSSNDLIGTFQMHVSANDYGKFTSSLKVAHEKSTASYLLEWEILEN